MFRIHGSGSRAVLLCLSLGLVAAQAVAGSGQTAPGGSASPPLPSPSTAAGVDLEAALERLASPAARVILARCVAVESLEDTGNPAVRLATFRIERTFKGPAETELTLRTRGRQRTTRSESKTSPARWSEDERIHYAPSGGAGGGHAGGGRRDREDGETARRARLERLRHLPPAPPSEAGRPAAPPAFRAGERALLFLPAMENGAILEAGAPGFAKLLVVSTDEGSSPTLIPVAGPGWLTAPAAAAGPSAPPLESLLDGLERHLESAGGAPPATKDRAP